ncbi:MAG: extracellular solute-binding protein [Oscillospiraceae bacterium]|nr:extracellular solute-binding protein [Oscillospiraceae bacterium]
MLFSSQRYKRNKRYKNLKRAVALALVASLVLSCVQGVVFAGDDDAPAPPRNFNDVLADNTGLASAGILTGVARNDLYQHYLARHQNEATPRDVITVPMSSSISEMRPNSELGEEVQYSTGSYAGRDNLLIWGNDLGEIDFTFNVPATGMYHLQFVYHTLTEQDAKGLFAAKYNWSDNRAVGMNNAIELGLLLNGEYPFASARRLVVDKLWQNEGATAGGHRSESFHTMGGDPSEHEMLPRQVQFHKWITHTVLDREGLFNEPMFFFLERGQNTITLNGIKVDGVAFESMVFTNFEELPPYASKRPSDAEIRNTPKLELATNDIGSRTILLEAEHPVFRSSTELGATYDGTTAGLSPYDPVKMRYNTAGGNDSWQQAGQALTWEFAIPETGYYRISAKFRQNSLRGFNTNRRVLVSAYDESRGVWSEPEVPVDEFNAVVFPYGFNWQQQVLSTPDGEEVYLKFEAGLHRVTFEVVPGEIGDNLLRLSNELLRLNYYYRRILQITGPNPDEFYPYEVDEQIPELLDSFIEIAANLRREKELIEGILGRGSEAATLETMAIILDRCVGNPDRIPQRLQSLRDNISSLAAWVRQAGRQPLELDYIEILTYDCKPASANAGFFRQIAFLWRGFLGSFFEDYTSLGTGEDVGNEINVWVGLGRDQTLTLKNLVDSGFNDDNPHNIWISVNLVQGGILEASLAGKGPDAALFIGGDFPIQLAARGLITDVSQFPDYASIVRERFTPQLPTIFTYLDGVYALPITQNFPMMFYRTDILSDLGLEPPRDWDEYEKAIAVLQRSYLGMGLLPPTTPPPMGVTITTFEPGDTFAILQSQTGQNFYRRDDESGLYVETMFDTPESIEAFNTWSRFYTVYRFEQSYDPFSRFRTGEFPIIIQPYAFYNMLNGAAPEIRGMWNFRHVPGTWRTAFDGEDTDRFIDSRVDPFTGETEYLDIAATSGASGGIIFNHLSDSEEEAAWEFLKWFTSDETQTQFGQNMEAMLGPLGRFDTANINAMRNLAWSAVELGRLETQRDALVEIPMIPANYSVIRHVRNAFRAVVNTGAFPRFALENYNTDINSEIARKNAEIARNRERQASS